MACFEGGILRGVPEFATDVVLETWQPADPTHPPKLTVRYGGKPIVIDGCQEYGYLCPLDVVRKAVQRFIPTDYANACGGTMAERNRRNNLPEDHEHEAHSDGTTF